MLNHFADRHAGEVYDLNGAPVVLIHQHAASWGQTWIVRYLDDEPGRTFAIEPGYLDKLGMGTAGPPRTRQRVHPCDRVMELPHPGRAAAQLRARRERRGGGLRSQSRRKSARRGDGALALVERRVAGERGNQQRRVRR